MCPNLKIPSRVRLNQTNNFLNVFFLEVFSCKIVQNLTIHIVTSLLPCVIKIIIKMKKLFASDWLKTGAFFMEVEYESVTRMQITNRAHALSKFRLS